MARKTRKHIPKIDSVLSEDDEPTLATDGELPAEGWDSLVDEDQNDEPENLIEEILAAVASSGDSEDDDEEANIPVAVARADDDDLDEDDEDDVTFAEVRARGKDEFTCQSCWLIRLESLRSPRDPSVCRDCD